MLINLSNHSVPNWSERQLNEARTQFGEVADVPFPQINPLASEEEVLDLAEKYFLICKTEIERSKDEVNAVHLMGEFTFVFALANMLIDNGIVCVVSTTERRVVEAGDKKISEFKFVKFRKYSRIGGENG